MSQGKRIFWGGTGLRVLLSHSHVDKASASELKAQLDLLGVQSFVAHEDIEPTRQWLDEMRIALDSMHILVALVTEEFKLSKWTDQEVGYAVASRAAVIPVGLGLTPYGFMSSVQALRGSESQADWAKAIVKFAFEQPTLAVAGFRSFLSALDDCPRYEVADTLRDEILPLVDKWTPKREQRFAKHYNCNAQVYEAARYGGSMFIEELNRRAKGHFSLKQNYKLEWAPF